MINFAVMLISYMTVMAPAYVPEKFLQAIKLIGSKTD